MYCTLVYQLQIIEIVLKPLVIWKNIEYHILQVIHNPQYFVLWVTANLLERVPSYHQFQSILTDYNHNYKLK